MTTEEIQEYIHIHQPVAAYLGQQQMSAFVEEMLAVHAPAKPARNPICTPNRPQVIYANTPIYEVTVASHVGFGPSKDL